MATLPDGWESDYDGTRWLYRYKPTGTIQYRFPQPGDEFAEFLLDAGTGPLQLSDEEKLAIEQAKQKDSSGRDGNTESGMKASGSRMENQETGPIGKGDGMSSAGYFDPSNYMYFSGACDDGDDDSGAVELPEAGPQIWSPVGYVAELATQETVKCAEELAPVELDATPSILAPNHTNASQQPAELLPLRHPGEKTANPMHTHPAMQPVDSYPVTFASFAYPPLKADSQVLNRVSASSVSEVERPSSFQENPAYPERNKYQPWRPTEGMDEQQPKAHNQAHGAVPRNSILRNQDTELGDLGQKGFIKNAENVPSTLAQPSDPRKSSPLGFSTAVNLESSPDPASQQQTHQPSTGSAFQVINQQSIPGTRARHESITVAAVGLSLSHAPSVLKPGSRQPNGNLKEKQRNSESGSSHLSNMDPRGSASPHHDYKDEIQVFPQHDSRSGITRVNTLPHNPTSMKPSPPRTNGSPGFLLFHEIPSAKISLESDSNLINQHTGSITNELTAMVAPLRVGKQIQSKSPEMPSINHETQGYPSPNGHISVPLDETYSTVSIVGKTMSSSAKLPVYADLIDSNGQGFVSNGEEMVGRVDSNNSKRPQQINGDSSSIMSIQHFDMVHEVNSFKPASIIATPATPSNAITSLDNVALTIMHSMPYTQPSSQQPSPSVQGSVMQVESHITASPPQNGYPIKVSMSPVQSKPSTNTSPLPSPQVSMTPPISHTQQVGTQSKPSHIVHNIAQQKQGHKSNLSASSGNVSGRIPGPPPAPNSLHQPQAQNNASSQPTLWSPIAAQSQTATQRPNIQQPENRPPLTYQGHAPAETQQLPYQQSSPIVAQTVSPLQSQVSSPSPSISSLHVSQSSTPLNTFSSTYVPAGFNMGPHINTNQVHMAPARPSSVPAQSAIQSNSSPPVSTHAVMSSPAGMVQAPPSSTANLPVKPYPMLPGQVTPLPSQIGSTPVPVLVQQSAHNNTKLTVTAQQAGAGKPSAQPSLGSITEYHASTGQKNSIPRPPQAVVSHGSSQAQIRPPQPQTSSLPQGLTHIGGNQHGVHHSQQQMVTPQQPMGHGQPQNSHQAPPFPPATGNVPVTLQYMFPPPPTGQVLQPAQTFSNSQAAAALAEAGKGMKKWAKKMLKNPAVKQTTAAFGGAVMAETVGISPVAGAQIANNIYGNSNRPPLMHAQTAPVQGLSQYYPLQPGQQNQFGKLQSINPLPNYQPGQPQPARPQPVLGQPGQTLPIQDQSTYPQPGPGRPQPTQNQPLRPPAGPQIVGRPPIAQNPAPPGGMAANFNSQVQTQNGFNQRQQYPMRPSMMGNQPPPGTMRPGAPGLQAQAQANADTSTAALVSSAIGAVFHQQQAQGSAQEHAQPEHTAHAESNGAENHEYASENREETNEQGYDSYVPPPLPPPPVTYADSGNYTAAETPLTYSDNDNYMATDTAATLLYSENSNYTTSDTTYIDNTNSSTNINTEIITNNVYIDNSSSSNIVDNTMYADTTTYSNAEYEYVDSTSYETTTTNFYSDANAVTYESTSDFAVGSVDYSGDAWGNGEF
ncbi:hypothetical protein GGS21DRAFT_535717 [Xylaria nigripes]|nr:hypothetical protein GGS21DRAFT_535717 [Xylaria nigripes]